MYQANRLDLAGHAGPRQVSRAGGSWGHGENHSHVGNQCHDFARREALTQGQASAAVAATMGKAKLFGLVVENKAITRGEGIIFRMKLGAPA